EGAGHDAELLKLVTSANIACGAHAGDPRTMFQTLLEARACNVRVGAHPGYFDRELFGRRELNLSHDEIMCVCVYQIGALKALVDVLTADGFPIAVSYIKPHGALYNQACREQMVALAVMGIGRWFRLPVLALPNSLLEENCTNNSVPFVREGFAD